jgi:hypothetical protein
MHFFDNTLFYERVISGRGLGGGKMEKCEYRPKSFNSNKIGMVHKIYLGYSDNPLFLPTTGFC